jgi:hypothetical protein
MAALTADRNTSSKEAPVLKSYPVKDNVKIYKGGFVCIDSTGYAIPGADASGSICVGIAAAQADNTVTGHTAGGINVLVESGRSFLMGGSSLTQAMVGSAVYITDSQTVQGTVPTNGTKAGRLVEYVSASSGWVFIPFGGVSRAITTADGSDAATTQALANAIKAGLNATYN